jgi:glycerol-3-phosphate acyltransferase PlsY
MTALMFVSVVVIGYLLGSIPFGLFIARIVAKKDVREVGTGKIGMTNVLRAAGKKAAAVSLVLDILKGTLAVTLAGLIFSGKNDTLATIFTTSEIARVAAALSAIAGHSWSIFLKFRGGRGVATFFGGMAALYWPAALIGAIFLFGIGFRSKYMSLGSIVGAVIATFLLMAFYVCKVNFIMPHPVFEDVVYALIGAIFIYVMHRDNILRLFNGTERKIGEHKTHTSPSTESPK